MKLDFDYRKYQEEAQQRLNKIFAESVSGQECDDCNCCTDDACTDDTYKMIQVILNCPEMEKCHPYLYSLDMENVNEADKDKIKKLYDLGENRGFITEKTTEEKNTTDGGEVLECDGEDCDDRLCGGPNDALTNQEMLPQPTELPAEQKPTFTVLYSSAKEGNIRIGEFYSKASNTDGAKEDCINQLTSQGHTAITVMAVEQNQFGVDTNVEDIPSDVNMYDVYEDDVKDEKQETGDVEDIPTIPQDDIQDGEVVAATTNDTDEPKEEPTTEKPTEEPDEETPAEEPKDEVADDEEKKSVEPSDDESEDKSKDKEDK